MLTWSEHKHEHKQEHVFPLNVWCKASHTHFYSQMNPSEPEPLSSLSSSTLWPYVLHLLTNLLLTEQRLVTPLGWYSILTLGHPDPDQSKGEVEPGPSNPVPSRIGFQREIRWVLWWWRLPSSRALCISSRKSHRAVSILGIPAPGTWMRAGSWLRLISTPPHPLSRALFFSSHYWWGQSYSPISFLTAAAELYRTHFPKSD